MTKKEKQNQDITHVGGIQIPDDLWVEFKAEVHERRVNRSELLTEILRERYRGKGKLNSEG